MRGKVEIVGRQTDADGRVLHPGWIELPWYADQLAVAAQKRDRRSGAGRRSGEARRQAENRPADCVTAGNADVSAPSDEEIDALFGDETTNNAPENTPVSMNNVHHLPLSREKERVEQEGKGKQEPVAPASPRGPLPEGWSVPDDWQASAAEARQKAGLPPVNLAAEAAKFVVHYVGQGTASKNWRASFLKWVLGAKVSLDVAPSGSSGAAAVNNAPENARRSSNIVQVPEPYSGLIDPVEWTRWFTNCRIEGGGEGVRVTAPTDFVRQRIETHYRAAIARAHGGASVEVVCG
jgi:hypothetical protein